jgi:hypothetical protein
MNVRQRVLFCAGTFALLFPLDGTGQMVTGAKMPGFAETFGITQQARDYDVEEIAVAAGQTEGVNLVLPGEQMKLAFRFSNKAAKILSADAELHVIGYRTEVARGDVWVPHVYSMGEGKPVHFHLEIPAKGTQIITLSPEIGERFGGYGLVVEVDGHGRAFAGTAVRSMQPVTGRVQYPTYALDATWPQFMNEKVFTLFERLGVKGMRLAASYAPQNAPEYAELESNLDKYMNWAKQHDVTVMLTLDNGSMMTQPLGRPRPWLSPDGTMLKTKSDQAWLPSYDQDFQNWVQRITAKYGWPQGNVNAVELWNEPWESTSISGWGADIPRYREIFTHMAEGVEAARKNAGVDVLTGGTCSSSNARDKLFADGSDTFLKWLDFVSLHYQPLAADASEQPEWINRKSPRGPVRIWDTESWIANSEDRFPAVIASMRAQGESRTAGIYGGNVYDSRNLKVDGKTVSIVQVWSPAASVAATQEFIGQREFRHLLFLNELPWVFQFDGLPSAAAAEDGTLVVVGDLKKLYDSDRTIFRSVAIAPDARLMVHDPEHHIRAYDSNGNAIERDQNDVMIPLNGSGYFLRGDGRAGSFAFLVAAVQSAHIYGIQPVEILAHDLLQPVDQGSQLRLTLTNVLNVPVDGKLSLQVDNLPIRIEGQMLHLKPHETRDVSVAVPVHGAAADNLYPVAVRFDAGPQGNAELNEDLHVNRISYRTISVDGNLDDWKGVLPQVLPERGIGVNLTESAWLPYRQNNKSAGNNAATAYLAYDDKFFYFAAKIMDDTPDPGMLRFANRDDNSYFYPDESKTPDGKLLTWPKNVRHYSYRRHFDVPSGSGEHDNVQIAFNVLTEKPMLPHPPGVMPRFVTYWDTDYEFALNPVASEYGGGTEIWRLQAPGIPRKHFFPRQPHLPKDGGPVGGKLVTRYDNGVRIVEAAIPWSEMPEVYARLKRGETIKFTCRTNDNKGPAHELATGRSVSVTNSFTFHDDWKTHWANELEFSAERAPTTQEKK